VNQEYFLQLLRSALLAIREPRFYTSERQYQGELLLQLRARLEENPIWPGSLIVEQEYQNSAAVHGLDFRPDLIIHCSFDKGVFDDRRQGNNVVLELQRRASRQAALQNYAQLDRICTVLDYAMGIFINVDATEIFLPESYGQAGDRLHGFAVELRADQVHIQEGHPYQSKR
jgi:hypothetical protein